MKRLLPLPKHVLVQLEDAPESYGGVYIPSASRDPESIGRVLEVGKDCPNLAVGNRVYVKTNHGTGLGLNGRKCVMMPYRDVLAIIE